MNTERLQQIREIIEDKGGRSYSLSRAATELVAEIERMRQAVSTLRRVNVSFRRGLDDDYSIREHPEGEFMDAADVLEALGIE